MSEEIKDTIEVSKGLLESIQKEIEQLKQDKNMLLEMADERKRSQYFIRHQSKLPKTVSLRAFQLDDGKGGMVEKIVIGWETKKDDVFKDPLTMRWTEIQKVNIIFEDGTSKEMHLLDWIRNYKKVKAKILSRSIDEEKKVETFKVIREDNEKEYEISSDFVN